jgi:hypothetical protein
MNLALRSGLLALLCLALLPALALAAPPAPQGNLVYQDDFSDKTKSGLEDNLRATDYSRGFHAPGVYHLIMMENDQTGWETFPDQSYSNFSYQLDVVDNSDDFNGNVSAGVVFRAQDDNHMYAVLIDSRQGQYSVRKLNGANAWSDIIPAKSSKLISLRDAENVLRVDGNGDAFTIYLNGEQLDTFKDAAFKAGGVGMIQSNVDAVKPHSHFDNVEIYTTDAAAPAALPTTGGAGESAPLALAAFAFALLLIGLWARQRR